MKIDNIAFIGMAGVGKSTISKKLAKLLDYNLVDTDDLIRKKSKMTLQEIIDNFGDEFCVKKEEEIILNLSNASRTIISTAGSCIYSEKAMKFLKEISTIIFLHLSYEEIKERISDLDNRGIIGLKTKTLKEIYNERLPLYEKYADKTIFISRDFQTKDILNEIKSFLKQSYQY